MNKELLQLLTLDDLHGESRELAETIGMDAFVKLVEVYGGTGRMYIPQADMLLIPVRDAKIREEYDGTNLYSICKKWELSEGTVRRIVQEKSRELRRAPIDGQISLFDT